MTLATKSTGAWVALPYGRDVVSPDGIQASYATFLLWSDADRQAFGVFTVPEPGAPPTGKVEANRVLDGDTSPVWTLTYADAPPPPAPIARSELSAIGGITITSAVIALNPDAMGLSSAIRVSIGRYRAYFAATQPDANYIPVLTVRDASDRRARLSAKTTTYVEMKTLDQTGAAADAQEIGIIVNRISWT